LEAAVCDLISPYRWLSHFVRTTRGFDDNDVVDSEAVDLGLGVRKVHLLHVVQP